MSVALVRRREVWLPTLWGWLLLLSLAALFAVGSVFAIYPLLAVQAPAPGARTLVVEGWLNDAELAQAITAARAGRYERVLTAGGPMDAIIDVGNWKNFALRAADQMRAAGLTEIPVVAVPAPASAQERTYLSAVVVRDWLQQNDPTLRVVDLYSVGVHTRRSWLAYRMALGRGGVEVGVRAARPTDYDPEHWWSTSTGAKMVIGEALGFAWTKCCFWPGPRGSHEERWAVPAAPAPSPAR